MHHLTRLSLAALTLTTAVGCMGTPARVPIRGSGGDVRAVAGSWRGSFRDEALQKIGSITFELAADRRSAVGELVLVWAGRVGGIKPAEGSGWMSPQSTDYLELESARVEADSVRVVMRTEEEPATGRTLRATFEGRVAGDVLKGTYAIVGLDGAELSTGEWQARRVGPAMVEP